MICRRCLFAAFLTSLCLAAVPKAADAQYDKLIGRIPTTTNTIILLNAEKVLNSAVALREGWRDRFDKAIEAGLTPLPEDTTQYVLASQMDFEFMQPVWQVGLLATSKPHSVARLANIKKGRLDTLLGLNAALMPTGMYVVQFDPQTFGAMAPADRQAVASWVRTTNASRTVLAPYIQEAVGYAAKVGTELIMAMDLRDVLDPRTVAEKAKTLEALTKYNIDSSAAAGVLSSIRGITLGVTMGANPSGMIKIDFGRDASVLAPAARPLILEVLARQGAMIDDLTTWEAKVNGSQIMFGGQFSSSGLRHIFSLIDAPVAEAVRSEAIAQAGPGAQDSPAVATQKYFKSVVAQLDDLRHHESPQRIAQIGGWFDKYARRIDRLPMVNVDDQAIEYGAYVAQQLRNAAAAIQGIGIRSRVRQVQAVNSSGVPGYYGVSYDGGYYHDGYYFHGGATTFARANYMQESLRQQQRVRTQVKVEEKAVGVSAARAIMKDIQNATSQVRRNLTKKFQIEF